jgi:1,4-dihydroxy-2-naphthoyl-CoA hydrolase
VQLDDLIRAGDDMLPGLLGVEIEDFRDGVVHAALEVRREHLAPNGYLHAAVPVALADTSCGYGCVLSLPEGASGFTTIELKTNFLRTARDGRISCEARLVHGGRTTQIWDATLADADGRPLALFRCTQLLLRD